jgi:hypothetical protein
MSCAARGRSARFPALAEARVTRSEARAGMQIGRPARERPGSLRHRQPPASPPVYPQDPFALHRPPIKLAAGRGWLSFSDYQRSAQ